MHALRTPAFFKPASRPSSPHPTSPTNTPRTDGETAGETRPTRPLTKKLALSHFGRRESPAPSRPSTPTTLVQDGSYLESLGLKLSEAASKALVQPVTPVATPDSLNGKRPIPPERGRAFGELIAVELRASKGNVHLQRAILRLLQRPLSVLITNLSSLLLPLISSPAFLNPAAPTVQAPNPNATQAHALAIAGFAGEMLDCIDELEMDVHTEPRGDSFKGFKEGLSSLMGRVYNPLLGGLKSDLLHHIKALEAVNPASPSSVPIKPQSGNRAIVHHHHSVATLQTLIPIYTRALKRYTAPKVMQSALATFLISVVWATLLSLSNRPSSPRSRSNSMSATSAASSTTAFKKKLGAGNITPPPTPPSSRFTMKLPGSRPPSPTHAPPPNAVADARMMCELLEQLPKPSAVNDAREAADEAFEALRALTALLGAVDTSEVREDLDLELLTEGLPVLIALPVMLRWSGHGEPQVIPAMLGIDENEYRDGCLSGFGRAEEYEAMIASRMADILRNDATEDLKTKLVLKYLEDSIIH